MPEDADDGEKLSSNVIMIFAILLESARTKLYQRKEMKVCEQSNVRRGEWLWLRVWYKNEAWWCILFREDGDEEL